MKKKENNRNTLKWIYARIKKYLPFIFSLTVISALVSLTTIGLALCTKKVLDVATGETSGSFTTSALMLFFIIAVQIVLSALNSFIKAYTSGKITIALRDYLFKTVFRKKYKNISSYHSGDLLNRFTSDTDVIVGASVSVIPNVVSMATKIIAGIGAMILMNRTLAIVVLVVGITVPAIGRAINKKYKHLHKECQKTEGETRSFLQECFQNTVVLKSFVSELPFIKKLSKLMTNNFRKNLKRTGLSITAHLFIYSFFTVGYYSVLLWGANGLSENLITYGTLTAFLQLISQLRAPLQNVSGIMPQYYSALASAERLIELENLENEPTALNNEELLKLKESFNSLDINNICFSYLDEGTLKNLSFSAERGHITAITGESGSGKSTLFKLLLGLYEPISGSITVNGNDKISSSTRGIFSYVPQGNMVLSGSIKDNITLFNPDISEEKLIEVSKAADIYEFVKETPNGFDTLLSERGAGLSEGQIQRISIARALLADAPILLLDEATSALDEETESRVLKNIKNMADKTVLFITHRNTSLKICDKIVHLN